MVTMVSAYDDTKAFYGLSTDTKPDDAPNGSIYVEMDTSKIYTFDAENKDWNEWGA